MNGKHVIEELSAYIDGEASDPARIARHLQLCEACARHHMQLMKLSAHLRAMPAPETRPEFVTRVMAHIAEEPIPSAWKWRHLLYSKPAWAMGLAVILVMTSLGGGWMLRRTSLPEPDPQIARPALEPFVPFPDPSPLEEIGNDAADTEDPVSYEELLAVLAESSSDEIEMASFFDNSDLDDQIDALDEQDTQALREVLSAYLQQSRTWNNEG